MAPALSAQKPPTGLSFVILCPMVCTMRQPPKYVPRAIADRRVCRQDNGPMQFSPVCQHVGFGHESSGVKCAGDNSHCLLSIVAAMTEAVCRSGQQLQLAKPLVDLLWCLTPQQPMNGCHKRKA